MRILVAFFFCLTIFSCTPQRAEIPKPSANTQTFIPVYLNVDVAQQVVYESPREIVHTGKIYTIGNYLLQVEVDSGIHVIDYTDRNAPVKIGFIRSLFCTEMSIKGDYLYINNLADLVVVDISNFNTPKEVNRIKGAFPKQNEFPPAQNVFFECPDPSKGVVIDWKIEIRDYPKCYR
jgi:hypothetical protein